MITRFSFRRWIAALSLGLTVSFFAGCAGRGQQVSQSEGGKFWRSSASEQTEVAKADDAETSTQGAKPEASDATGRVRIASLGDAETAEQVAGSDPFLNEPEPTAKPVAQVAAEEPTPAPRTDSASTERRVSAIDAELDRLRRDALQSDTDTANDPSLEWADDVAAAPAPEPVESTEPAPEQPRREVAAAAGPNDSEIWDTEQPSASASAGSASGDVVEVPMSREIAPVESIDRAMIVDTIEINPRRIHDPSVRGTSGRADVELDREVESSTTRDALWSFERDDSNRAADATLIEQTSDAGTAEDEMVADAGPSFDEGPSIGNPLLLPPAESTDEEISDPAPTEEVEEESIVPSLNGPSLFAPAADTDSKAATVEAAEEVADAFPFDPAPEVVTALDALEFAEEPEPATTASNSSIGWWFGGFAIAAIVLLVRARRRLLA